MILISVSFNTLNTSRYNGSLVPISLVLSNTATFLVLLGRTLKRYFAENGLYKWTDTTPTFSPFASCSCIFAISALSVLSLAIISCNTTIYTSKSQIKGLTTSVALWGVGFIGLALGAGLYLTTIILIVIFVLSLSMLPKVETYLKNRSNHFEVHLELTNASYLKDFTTVLRELGIKIYELENNPAYFNSGLSVYTMSLSITKEELQKYKTHQEIIEALKSLPYVAYIEEISF